MDTKPQLAELGDVAIAYHDWGQGRPILLIHGFASNARMNWLTTGWVKVLLDSGRRVIALDNRGHGESTKFYTPADYGPDIFAGDSIRLLDHLDIGHCDVMGYSMGARITAWLCHNAPARVGRAVFGGMGAHIFGGRGGYEAIAEALETEKPDEIDDPGALAFRKFADNTNSDRFALAACIRPSKVKITAEIVAAIGTPVLIAVGSKDDIAGSPVELAAMMPNAKPFVIEGLDHMKATGAPAFKAEVLDFLGEADGA